MVAAEEAKAEEQLLAQLEEKVLKRKETMSSVLAAQSLGLEKLASAAELVRVGDPSQVAGPHGQKKLGPFV